MKHVSLGVAAAGMLLLAACDNAVERQAARTGNAIAVDVDRTTDNLSDRIGALATDVDGRIGNISDRAIDAQADRLERHVERQTDRAADAAGNALEEAGRALQSRDEQPEQR